MNKNFMIRILLALSAFILLQSCGGGGDSTDPVVKNETKTFTVSLTNVTVKRKSNSEIIEVDTSSVKSAEMTYK